MAFATVADLEARWRTLTSEEQALAATLLDDAAVKLSEWVIEDDELQAAKLKIVSCDMVKRAMIASTSSAFGVEQLDATMGPMSQTAHFVNPNGDLYVSKQEKRMLRVRGDMGRILHPAYGVSDDD